MHPTLPTLIVVFICMVFFLELIFWAGKKHPVADLMRKTGLTGCIAGILYVVSESGRPPLYGPFEAVPYMILIMALLSKHQTGKSRSFHCAVFSIMAGAALAASPLAVNTDYFMYDNLWVLLFFNLRLVSAAFFVHAAVLQLAGFTGKKKGPPYQTTGSSRQYLAGVFFYLVSEWSGSLWCLNWYGDSWHWSSGFLKASILFLLVMVHCHFPKTGSSHWPARMITGILPGCFSLWMIF